MTAVWHALFDGARDMRAELPLTECSPEIPCYIELGLHSILRMRVDDFLATVALIGNTDPSNWRHRTLYAALVLGEALRRGVPIESLRLLAGAGYRPLVASLTEYGIDPTPPLDAGYRGGYRPAGYSPVR